MVLFAVDWASCAILRASVAFSLASSALLLTSLRVLLMPWMSSLMYFMCSSSGAKWSLRYWRTGSWVGGSGSGVGVVLSFLAMVTSVDLLCH